MESEKKMRGLKGKLVKSLYKAPKPSVQYLSKVKVKPTPMTSVGFRVGDEHAVVSPATIDVKKATLMEGGAAKMMNIGELPDDDSIDIKTASYISYVREMFML